MIWWRNPGLPRLLWPIGAAAWVASQLLEACQWGWWWTPDEAIDSYSSLMVTEETLEMLGSTFFILALFKINWPKGLMLPRQRGNRRAQLLPTPQSERRCQRALKSSESAPTSARPDR